ncbi:DUF4124 domain-containing protein [Luteimonas sp. 3794]|uniref:DUF4124 domain-containing protein n=1 Tax=Luteimonas sp. 3794 TaxID=2817730 RepID=UPI0028601EED|nr:DUF4124 domain-containing protein [Luteimonas sp. 3794]MDR6991923.1 hypothetical protein [Luteimonas sp. 3794]
MKRSVVLSIALTCALASGGSAAVTTVIYRCTDAAGAVTFQNGTACPAGHTQQRRVVEMATPMPAFVSPPAPSVAPPQVPLISRLPAAEALAPREEDAQRQPPPALFACRVFDNSSYWREDDSPPLRCRPMRTVGIGGLPGLEAGQACEQVADVCEAVPVDALCSAWETRVREAEFRWRYAQTREQPPLRLEYEQLFSTWRDSSCGPGAGVAPAAD